MTTTIGRLSGYTLWSLFLYFLLVMLVTWQSTAQAQIGDPAACSGPFPVITPGDSLDVSLDASTDCFVGNRLSDRYSLSLSEETLFRATASTEGFDPLLILIQSSGSPLAIRAGMDDSTVHAEYLLPAGDYLLIAGSRITDETAPPEGDYTLSLTSALSMDQVQDVCTTSTLVSPGHELAGELTAEDCRDTSVVDDETSPYQDIYQFILQEGQIVYPVVETDVPVRLIHWFDGAFHQEYEVAADDDIRLTLNREGSHLFFIVGQSATDLGNYQLNLSLSQSDIETVPVSFIYRFAGYRDTVEGELVSGPSDHVLRGVVEAVFDGDDIFEVISFQEGTIDGNAFNVGANPGIVSFRPDTPALLSLSGDLLDVLVCPDGFTSHFYCAFGSEGGLLVSDFWPLSGDIAGQSGALAGHPALGNDYYNITTPLDKSAWSAQVINHSAQRDALVALYNATNGASWASQDNWLGEAGTECSWYGVSCNDHGNIEYLGLNNNNLSGSVPVELANLGTALAIELSNNQLNGAVPPAVLAMDTVDLWGNPDLTGIEFGSTDACDSQAPLALGALANGELTPFEDCYFDDDRIMVDFYRLDLSGESGVTTFTIEAHADNYHPHMGVLDASGHEGEDIVDTQVQDNDLSFEVSLPPGEYVLYIHGGTYQPQNVAATGSYALTTTTVAESQLGCMMPTWVSKGVSLDGAISSDDCLDTFNDPDRLYDSYAIWLPEGDSVLVSVTSQIQSQLLHFIAYDFNALSPQTPAGQQHSLAYTATDSGWHQFAVYNTPANPLEEGNYHITFEETPTFGDQATCTVRPTVVPGDIINAALSQTNDCFNPQGRMLDFYEFSLNSDTLFRVTADTDGFDPTLVLLQENPQTTLAGRSGFEQDSLTAEFYLSAGEYTLVATSRIANQASPVEGDYTLTLSSVLSATDIQDGCLSPSLVFPGAIINAELSVEDCRDTSVVNDESSPYIDSYQVMLQEGQLVYPLFYSDVDVRLVHRFNGELAGEYTIAGGDDIRLTFNRSGQHNFDIIGQSADDLGSYELDLLLQQPDLDTVPVGFSYTFDSYRDVVGGENQIGDAEHVLTGIVEAVFDDDGDTFEVISIQEATLDGNVLAIGANPGIAANRDNIPALLSLTGAVLDTLICPNGFSLQLDCPFGTEGGLLFNSFFGGEGSLALAGHPELGENYRARSYPINLANWSASIIGYGAPEGSDNSISLNEDQSYSFAEEDFGFSDADDNTFIAVRITSLPTAGQLQLDGVNVSAGQEVAIADLPLLTFTPVLNANGSSYSSLTFQVKDNGLDVDAGRENSTDLDPSPNTITIDVASVNDAPAGSNLTVDMAPGTQFVFSQSVFGFSDSLDLPVANLFASVTIDSVPEDGEGELLLNGVDVSVGAVIAAADISDLVYIPPQNVTENEFTQINFRVTDDGGEDNGGVDTDETARSIIFNVGVVPPVVVDPDPTPDEVTDELDDLNNELDDIESITLEEGQPVSEDVINQVGNALDRTNSLAQQVTQSLPEGEAGVNVALNALGTMSRTLKASARVSANGGAVSNTSAANSINSVATVLNSLSSRSENITSEQRATVQTMVSETVGNSSDLIRNGASNDELVNMVAATSAVINAASAAGGELNSELVTQAEALVTKAVKTGLSSFSPDIDVEDPVQVENLLRDNPEALEFAIEASVAVKSRIQPDSGAVAEELSSRGIEDSASERFTQVLSAVSNPDGVSVGGTSGSEILLSALVSFLSGGSESLTFADGRQAVALSAGDIDLTIDSLTGTALVTAPGETYSVAVVNTRIVSSSVPEGLSFMRDGRALIVSDGVAIELAPVAVDLIGFTDTVEKAGFEMTLRDGGVVDIALSDEERFIGVFAFDNLSGVDTRCDSNTTLVAPVGEVDSPAYAFSVQCAAGATQRVVPFVHDAVFYRTIVDYGLGTRTDRNTGVITISNTGKFKPGFFVSALTTSDMTYLEANKDVRGVAFRFLDLNNDGQQDALFYTASGVQPMYGVMP